MSETQGGTGSSKSPIEFGERKEWIRLYRERLGLSKALKRVVNVSEGNIGKHEDLLRQQLKGVQEFLTNRPPAATGDFLTDHASFVAFLEQQERQALTAANNLLEGEIGVRTEELMLDASLATAENAYEGARKKLRERYLFVGHQYEEEPPHHISRAIGSPLSVFTESWVATRGAIEAYRFVTRQKDPNVTLGPRPQQAWARGELEKITYDIQHVQLLHIATSPDPLLTADLFGRSETVMTVGLPPEPSQENLRWSGGTWLEEALQHVKAIEPTEGGLLIDNQG